MEQEQRQKKTMYDKGKMYFNTSSSTLEKQDKKRQAPTLLPAFCEGADTEGVTGPGRPCCCGCACCRCMSNVFSGDAGIPPADQQLVSLSCLHGSDSRKWPKGHGASLAEPAGPRCGSAALQD